jgi:hypothetical protein
MCCQSSERITNDEEPVVITKNLMSTDTKPSLQVWILYSKTFRCMFMVERSLFLVHVILLGFIYGTCDMGQAPFASFWFLLKAKYISIIVHMDYYNENTIDWVICKQQEFIVHSYRG